MENENELDKIFEEKLFIGKKPQAYHKSIPFSNKNVFNGENLNKSRFLDGKENFVSQDQNNIKYPERTNKFDNEIITLENKDQVSKNNDNFNQSITLLDKMAPFIPNQKINNRINQLNLIEKNIINEAAFLPKAVSLEGIYSSLDNNGEKLRSDSEEFSKQTKDSIVNIDLNFIDHKNIENIANEKDYSNTPLIYPHLSEIINNKNNNKIFNKNILDISQEPQIQSKLEQKVILNASENSNSFNIGPNSILNEQMNAIQAVNNKNENNNENSEKLMKTDIKEELYNKDKRKKIVNFSENNHISEIRTNDSNRRNLREIEEEFSRMKRNHLNTLKMKSKIYQFIYAEISKMDNEYSAKLKELEIENKQLKEKAEYFERKYEKYQEFVKDNLQKLKSNIFENFKKYKKYCENKYKFTTKKQSN